MESSHYQASLGKKMIGAIVVNEHGRKIIFLRALARNLTKLLSIITVIGVILIAFTKRKRDLHDVICNTYVVHRN